MVIAAQRAPCEPHGRRAEILLRARQLHRAFPGLGDAALRLVLAASGHRVAALADAVDAAAPRQGHCRRRPRNGAATPAAADVHRCPRFRSQRRRSARRRGVPRSAERRGLRRELAGDGARRVRRARLDHRPVPDGQPAPYRIDLFDDEVESIRVFDPETQRSGERAQALRLLPAREFPPTADGIQNFKRRFRNRSPAT